MAKLLPVNPMLETNEKIVFIKNAKPLAVYIKHPTKDGMMKPEKMFATEKGV